MPPHLTATSDELATLASTAFEIIDDLEWVRFDPPDAEDDEAGAVASARAAMAALLYCVVAALPLADPELVPIVVDCLQVLHDDGDIDSRSADDAAIALLSKIGRATEAVRELVASADERDRYVVASGLRPVGEDEIALARARTGYVDTRTSGRSDGARARRRRAVVVRMVHARSQPGRARIGRGARGDHHRRAPRRGSGRLARSVEATRARRPCAPRCAGDRPRHARAPSRPALRNEGGGGPGRHRAPRARRGVGCPLLAILARWKGDCEAIFPEASTGMVKGLREPRRGEVCLGLARFALAASSDDDDRAETAQLVASVAGRCWPATTDPAPLLDEILALGAHVPGSTRERIVSDLGGAFSKVPAVDGALLTRAVGLRLLGYPRGTASIAHSLDAFVLRAPARIARDVAERATRTNHLETIVFGLEHLYGRGYDRRRDPPRRSLLQCWLASPTLRPAVFASHAVSTAAMRLLRGDVVRGALPFAEAVRVMWSLTWSGGGSASMDSVLSPTRFSDSEVFDQRWTPTDEEWRAYRALRAQRVAHRIVRPPPRSRGRAARPVGAVGPRVHRAHDRRRRRAPRVDLGARADARGQGNANRPRAVRSPRNAFRRRGRRSRARAAATRDGGASSSEESTNPRRHGRQAAGRSGGAGVMPSPRVTTRYVDGGLAILRRANAIRQPTDRGLYLR